MLINKQNITISVSDHSAHGIVSQHEHKISKQGVKKMIILQVCQTNVYNVAVKKYFQRAKDYKTLKLTLPDFLVLCPNLRKEQVSKVVGMQVKVVSSFV